MRLLAPHRRPDNFDALVRVATGKSKREVEVLVACLAPRPDVASSVRKVRARVIPLGPAAAAVARTEEAAVAVGTEEGAGAPAAVLPLVDGCSAPTRFGTASASTRATPFTAPGAPEPSSCAPAAVDPVPAALPRPAEGAIAVPLAPCRYQVQFTVSEETHEKLRRAQDLLRREIPDGDPGAIFDRALTLLLEDVARNKLAATSSPRPVAETSGRSRRIPAHVRRAVWLRDAGRCAFVAPNGRRCAERAFLEFHHQDPYALGRASSQGHDAVRNPSTSCGNDGLADPARDLDGHSQQIGDLDGHGQQIGGARQ